MGEFKHQHYLHLVEFKHLTFGATVVQTSSWVIYKHSVAKLLQIWFDYLNVNPKNNGYHY